MADLESIAARAERRRNEQKVEEERRLAAQAAARLTEVVAEWKKMIGKVILIEGVNGVPVEVHIKRVGDNGYLCVWVPGGTGMGPDTPGLWMAMANVKVLDDLGSDPTPLGAMSFAAAVEAPGVAEKPKRVRVSRKSLTETPASE